MSRLSSAVADGAQRFGVLLSPRNLLQDETEKETLLHALIEVLLPTVPRTSLWCVSIARWSKGFGRYTTRATSQVVTRSGQGSASASSKSGSTRCTVVVASK